MNKQPPIALLHGIKILLDKSLNAKPSKAGFCSKTTALALAKGEKPPGLDLNRVIAEMWKQIATNWVDGGCQWRGAINWQWKLRESLDVKKQNPSKEVRLNRTLARALSKTPNKDRWANEIPTGSGMAEKGGAEPGGLDLAYNCPPDRVFLIELKVDTEKSDGENPVSAAFQVVSYALVMNLARLVHERLLPKKGKAITISEKWSRARHADLRVLAPTSYYSDYPKLGWFEDQLNKAIADFDGSHGIEMSFAFRRFDEEPTGEPQLLAALDQKVKWH